MAVLERVHDRWLNGERGSRARTAFLAIACGAEYGPKFTEAVARKADHMTMVSYKNVLTFALYLQDGDKRCFAEEHVEIECAAARAALIKANATFSIIYSYDHTVASHSPFYIDEYYTDEEKEAILEEAEEEFGWTGIDAELRPFFAETEREYEDATHHRKYCAILGTELFEQFCEAAGLSCSMTETMGSIGPPGFGISHTSAIAFDAACAGGDGNAYVTPYCLTEPFSLQTQSLEMDDAAMQSLFGFYGMRAFLYALTY